MEALASCIANNPGEQNIRRNLHKVVHARGKTLPLEITGASCNVKKALGKIGTREILWPVILLSTWMRYALLNASQLLLGGHHISMPEKWKRSFRKFWRRYRRADPDHPIFHSGVSDYGIYLPYTIHGDEGRGRNKVPIMVESFCPVIGRRGQRVTNLKGKLGCSTVCHVFGSQSMA